MLHSTDSCRISGQSVLARSVDDPVAANDFESSGQAVGNYDAKAIIGFAIAFGGLVAVIVIVAVCFCLRLRERFGTHTGKDVDPMSPCSIDLPMQMPGPEEEEDYRGYQFTLLRQPSAETGRADRNSDDKWTSGDGATVIMFPRVPLSNDADGQRRNLTRPSRGRPRRWTVQEMR